MIEPPDHQSAARRIETLLPGDPSGLVRGQPYFEWVDTVKKMKRDGNLAAAVDLLLECVAAVEAESRRERSTPAPWYYQQLGILFRKLGDGEASSTIAARWDRVSSAYQR